MDLTLSLFLINYFLIIKKYGKTIFFYNNLIRFISFLIKWNTYENLISLSYVIDTTYVSLYQPKTKATEIFLTNTVYLFKKNCCNIPWSALPYPKIKSAATVLHSGWPWLGDRTVHIVLSLCYCIFFSSCNFFSRVKIFSKPCNNIFYALLCL